VAALFLHLLVRDVLVERAEEFHLENEAMLLPDVAWSVAIGTRADATCLIFSEMIAKTWSDCPLVQTHCSAVVFLARRSLYPHLKRPVSVKRLDDSKEHKLEGSEPEILDLESLTGLSREEMGGMPEASISKSLRQFLFFDSVRVDQMADGVHRDMGAVFLECVEETALFPSMRDLQADRTVKILDFKKEMSTAAIRKQCGEEAMETRKAVLKFFQKLVGVPQTQLIFKDVPLRALTLVAHRESLFCQKMLNPLL